MAIRYLVQEDIDYSRWDRCIHLSLNSEVYVFSWFLDAIAGTWDALVEDDYRAVMPLVNKRKFLTKVIYRHPLLNHLGIFSESPVKADKIMSFLESIPDKFTKIEICFNRQNTQALRESFSGCRSVYEMDLIVPYEKKERSYPDEIKNAIGLAQNRKLSVMKHIALSELESLGWNCYIKMDTRLSY